MSGKAGLAVSAAAEAAEANGWPLLRAERGFGKVAIFLAAFSAAMATWCFAIGGFVAFYLKATPGTFAILAGSLLGILMVVLATLPMSVRYGIDAVIASRPQLGTRGSYVSVFLVYASAMGWSIILFIYKGHAITDLLMTYAHLPKELFDPVASVIGVLAIFLVLSLIWKGPEYIRSRGPVVAIMVAVMSLVILLLLVQRVGVHGILTAVAVSPYPDAAGNWASSMEVLIVSNLSWWAYTGSIVRTSRTSRGALWPIVLGFGLGVGLGSLVGLYTGLAVKGSNGDPTSFLLSQGGVIVGVVMVVFLLVANIGTAMMGIYAASVAVRQLPKVGRLKWRTTIVLVSVPAMVIVALFANSAESFFSLFLAFLGVAFAPICGIQIADWFLLRRQRYDVRSLYVLGRSSKYYFTGGFNIVGFVSFAAGIVTYIYLLDPVTYVYRTPFQYLTASFPSAFVAALAYTIGTLVFLRPRGAGGYGADRPLRRGREAAAEDRASDPVAVAEVPVTEAPAAADTVGGLIQKPSSPPAGASG